jgi:hypothetical protein
VSFLGLILCFWQSAQAQIVKGVLISAADDQPVPYGTILSPDGTDRFTDARGQFTLGDIHDGTYHIRARMLGYSPLDTSVTFGPGRSPLVLHITPVALRLSTVAVNAERERGKLTVCVQTGRRASDAILAAIFDQLDVNVERYNLLREKYPFTYRRVETEIVQTTNESDSVVSVDTVAYDSRDRRPYQVGSIVFHDTKATGQQRTIMYLPTFGDLGDSAFDAAHCFAYMGQKKGEIRIDFRPADRIAAPDVEGSIFLDASKYILRRAIFRLTKPKLVSSSVIGLTITTTFDEAMPLVPILQTTRTEQPLMAIRSQGVDPRVGGRSPTSFDLHPLLQRVAIETDTVIGHTFIAGTIGGEPVEAAAAPAPPAKPITIAVNCTMPPSFETIDIPIYGTVGGAHPGNPNNDRLTLGIRRQFRMPANLDLPVYGFAQNAKVAPTVTGQVTFTLASGRVSRLQLTATSLLPAVDSALVSAVRRADSLKSFVGVPAGQYTVSLSSLTPDAGALATDVAHVSVSVVPLAHQASLDTDAPAPLLPTGNGTFEFVVDEHGHVIPATLRTLKTSSPDFALAVEKGLEKLRYQPAVAGTCPVKQVVQQPFQALMRVREQ